MDVEFILYVADQELSKTFYSEVLALNPVVHVPGITEFVLGANIKFGLMPETGIHKILIGKTPNPASGQGIPRCELYLKVVELNSYVERAMHAGAKMVSESADRDWGDRVCYVADPDGHIIAFAQSV